MNNPSMLVVLFRNTGLSYRVRRRIGLGFMVDVPGRNVVCQPLISVASVT